MTAPMRDLRLFFFGDAVASPIISGMDRANCVRKPVEGERQLGAFILPPFQRESVWRESQKSALIESIFMGLPFGSYVVNHGAGPASYGAPPGLWLLDGQQRWTSILEYVADGFPVRGRYWSELDVEDRRVFKLTPFPSHIVKYDDTAVLEDLYNRLAYGGTPHEEPAPAPGP